MDIRSDNMDGTILKVFTNPTGDDYFIATYNQKDGYNGFTTPTVKICGPGAGGNLDVPEDIRYDLLKVLKRLATKL